MPVDAKRIEYMRDRIAWLRETLIPDLRDSGSDATAADFRMCASMIEELLDERESKTIVGEFVHLAQGSGFDSLYAFADPETRDLFAAFNEYENTGEAVILDESFVYSNALEQVEEHNLGIYLTERGVSFDDMPGHAMLELLRWYTHNFDDTPDQSDATWERNQGPALDAKAHELIESGYYPKEGDDAG